MKGIPKNESTFLFKWYKKKSQWSGGPYSNNILALIFSAPDVMTFVINTHASWGIVQVANIPSLEEARKVFAAICEDPWHKRDRTVMGVELVLNADTGARHRLEWFAFR